jgi:hypothetical protein
MAAKNADAAVSAEGYPKTFYDSQGREYYAHNAQDEANARFSWGYSETKPKDPEDPPVGPVGDPGPTSGAVAPNGAVL